MFQLLTLIAMEPPVSLQGEGVRNEKVKVLQAIHPPSHEAVLQNAVRGQYGAGVLNGKRVPAYREEPNVAPNSNTETYAGLKILVDNWRWAGVPFYLRSGKRLARRDPGIVVQLNRAPLLFFLQTRLEEMGDNRLILPRHPAEGTLIQIT